MRKAPAPRHIGILLFEGVAALDLSGVLDAFFIAGGADWKGRPKRYAIHLIGMSMAPVRAESGLRLVADVTLANAPPLDTIVVPGGPGLREAATNAVIAAWLRGRAKTTRRIVSVCTGLYGLAASGLLDGRRATTHWLHAADAARRFPNVRIQPDAIFIKDGPFYSSAGMSAGIDLALSLIEEDHGGALALTTARQMVVYVKRSGGQMQYSEPLRFQTRAGDRFDALASLIVSDLAADWSVENMAARTGLSARQFSRRFKTAFATSPAIYVERLRLDEARQRLSVAHENLARLAYAIGFQSDDAFRRAFERRFGVTPSAYRNRFSSSKGAGHEAVLHS